MASVRPHCKAQKITSVLPSNSWAGETAILIGGGPSLVGFDWGQLKEFHVIGINKSFQAYPQAEVNISLDTTFFSLVQLTKPQDVKSQRLSEDWKNYPGIKLFVRHSPKENFAPGIFYVDELKEKQICFDLDRGIHPGNNSGLAALLLAVALGCKRIGLLGYDFKVQGDKTHWHEGYVQQNVSAFSRKLFGFCQRVDEFAKGIQDLGIAVFNLSPDSLLQNYPKISFSQFKHQ